MKKTWNDKEYTKWRTFFNDKNGTPFRHGDVIKSMEYPFYHDEDKVHNYSGVVLYDIHSNSFCLITLLNKDSDRSGISHMNGDAFEEGNFDFSAMEIIGDIVDPEQKYFFDCLFKTDRQAEAELIFDLDS